MSFDPIINEENHIIQPIGKDWECTSCNHETNHVTLIEVYDEDGIWQGLD